MTGIIRIALSDKAALERLSARRPASAYLESMDRAEPLPPPNVNRHLLTYAALQSIRRTGLEDLHLRIITCPLQGCIVPLHLALAFRHRRLTVTGPVFISVLHLAGFVLPPEAASAHWAAPLSELSEAPSAAERRALIEHYLASYLAAPEADLTVIAVPARSAADRLTSPTHQAFTSLAVPGILQLGTWHGYLFTRQAGLHVDPELHACLRLLRASWAAMSSSPQIRAAAAADAAKPGHGDDELRKVATILHRIRAAWRAASVHGGNLTMDETSAFALRERGPGSEPPGRGASQKIV